MVSVLTANERRHRHPCPAETGDRREPTDPLPVTIGRTRYFSSVAQDPAAGLLNRPGNLYTRQVHNAYQEMRTSMNIARCWASPLLSLLLLCSSVSAADDVSQTLRQLHEQSLWGEITLATGGVRQVHVQSMSDDSVSVTEVIGPLHQRPAAYAVASIRSARELGVYRIQQRMAPYRAPRSRTVALGLELVIPGAGYFYAGDARQGYTILGFAAVVVGSAIATGNDGAAGWAPFAAWVKIASLAHLRDQVDADNAAYRDRADGLAGSTPTFPVLALRF